MSGKFITLEGGEGVGKSTLAKAISEHFLSIGIPHKSTREPGGTPVAEKIRSITLAEESGRQLSPLAVALLMNAARADHLEVLVRPALFQGHHVICDRFTDSTLAYQSVGGGVSSALLEFLCESVVGETLPNLTLLLDADPEALMGRREARAGVNDVFESKGLAFHHAIRSAFLDLANKHPARIKVLDALEPPDVLAQKAIAMIKGLDDVERAS